MFIALELGLLYAIMAIGVYLTYRVLDFPDLTVDGSFTTGAAVAAVMIMGGMPPWLTVMGALIAGMAAGLITGLLHVWGGINALLAGILTQLALYSINLRIMGVANISLLRSDTLFTPLREAKLTGTWTSVGILFVIAALIGVLVYFFLGTRYGVGIRATGDNELMAKSQGIDVGRAKLVGLSLSNGLVALAGALVAQFQGFADISMGIGMIVAGLASVIIGQAIIGRMSVWQSVLAAAVGSVLYRAIIQAALSVGLDPNDMKLVSAVLVVLALVIPSFAPLKRWKRKRFRQKAEAQMGGVA